MMGTRLMNDLEYKGTAWMGQTEDVCEVLRIAPRADWRPAVRTCFKMAMPSCIASVHVVIVVVVLSVFQLFTSKIKRV